MPGGRKGRNFEPYKRLSSAVLCQAVKDYSKQPNSLIRAFLLDDTVFHRILNVDPKRFEAVL